MSRTPIELHLSAPPRVRVGESVDVSVALRNAGRRPAWVVGVVPGAEGGSGLPRYLPRVVAHGRVLAAPARVGVPLVPRLRLRDFRRLAPGEAVDPTQGAGEHGWTALQTFVHFRPQQPGPHVFVVTLCTGPQSPQPWLRVADLGDDRDELLARIAEMPPLVVESNRLEVLAV